MDIDKKLIELNKMKGIMEAQAKEHQASLVGLQQIMSNLNKDYLILLGKIEAFEEMNKK